MALTTDLSVPILARQAKSTATKYAQVSGRSHRTQASSVGTDQITSTSTPTPRFSRVSTSRPTTAALGPQSDECEDDGSAMNHERRIDPQWIRKFCPGRKSSKALAHGPVKLKVFRIRRNRFGRLLTRSRWSFRFETRVSVISGRD